VTAHIVKEAKDFLAKRIASEAVRQSVPLSEVERKMLYWSETDWTLPNMKEVGEAFDRDYDQGEYEQKIAGLIANITAERHHRNQEEEEKWDAAADKLSEGDHYLSVLIGNVHESGGDFLPSLRGSTVRPRHDRLKLWTTAFAIVFALVALGLLKDHFFPDGFWQTVGSHIDKRAAPLLLVLILAGYLLLPKLWQILRARLKWP
jgi:hypothetical protein